MNISFFLGVLSAVGMMVATFMMSDLNTAIFLNMHAIMVVIGGTFSAALLCFSLESIWKMTKVFLSKVMFRRGLTVLDTIDEITDLARGYRQDPEYLKTKLPQIRTMFLKEALEMLIQGGISPERMTRILSKRSKALFLRYEEDAQMFKVIAKFPPAFGLMGTTLGMIGLMQGLGGENSMKMVGPAMGIALVATFYGIGCANLILIPMGEHLAKLNRHDAFLRKVVIDGIVMIQEKQHHILVAEDLKSYLLPSERTRQRQYGAAGGQNGNKAA